MPGCEIANPARLGAVLVLIGCGTKGTDVPNPKCRSARTIEFIVVELQDWLLKWIDPDCRTRTLANWNLKIPTVGNEVTKEVSTTGRNVITNVIIHAANPKSDAA